MPSKLQMPFKADSNRKLFKDIDKASAYINKLYKRNTDYLCSCFDLFTKGVLQVGEHVSAHYPYMQITVKKNPSVDRRRSYGFVSQAGVYRTTLTRPDIFDFYYKEQIALLLENHENIKLEIGVSDTPIPLHFALGDDFHLEADLNVEQLEALPQLFDLPDLAMMDDKIANGTYRLDAEHSGCSPLALFTAPRVDLSLQRLRHYTGSSAEHVQNFVLYTNYQFYIDEFIRHGLKIMSMSNDSKIAKQRSEYLSFVEPGNKITHNANIKGGATSDGYPRVDGSPTQRIPQMPAYHLKRADGSGITMINIGVGPSNAKTITDHIAVLRPHAWLMLGHCAGLRNSQALGDYVLAHGYVREDGILDNDLPITIPIPALSEMQIALEAAMCQVTGMDDYELKNIMRTGTVATINDRNWELRDQDKLFEHFSQSRAIALDMESATIAANGFRFRVPYGTLLCVSDKPLHGQLKLPGMANDFYRERVDQHLKIGLLAMEYLRKLGVERLHSRKLRSFSEVAFQ